MTEQDKKPGALTPEMKLMAQQLIFLESELISRSTLSTKLGLSYDGTRDLYAALGYPQTLTFDHYNNLYKRQDVANRLVNTFPDATWRQRPEVYDDEDPKKETPFEKAWKALIRAHQIWRSLVLVDRLAGIGRYAVLYMAIRDGKKPEEPVEPAQSGTGDPSRLLYLQAYTEGNAVVNSFESDPTNARYGLPLTYKLKVRSGNIATGASSSVSTQDVIVHYTRCLHVADGAGEDPVYGTPRLECVYNRLSNLDLVAGGSAEMYWRAAFFGLSLEQDANTPALTETQKTALNTEVDEYIHNLRRVLRLRGMRANPLAPNVSDPGPFASLQLDLISAASRVPKRILMGSERGELASSQDEKNWNDRVDERRQNFAQPCILEGFVKAMVDVGVLPKPQGADGKALIYWPGGQEVSEKDKSETVRNIAQAWSAYASGGVSEVLPPRHFMLEVMQMDPETVDTILEEVEAAIEEDRRLLEEERAATEEAGEEVEPGEPAAAPVGEEGGGEDESRPVNR